MMNKLRTLAAITAALIGSGTALGQGLLDQQLGPTPPAAEAQPPRQPLPPPPIKAADKTPVAVEVPTGRDPGNPPATLPGPAAKPDRPQPGATDLVSSGAAKKVDDDELLNQLLQPGAKPDPSDVAKRLHTMVERMQQTAQLLTDKDPGEVTQETQRRIVADLDVMIELARQQQQSNSSSSPSQPQDGQPRIPGPPQGGQTGEGGTVAATHDPLTRGGYSDPVTGDMRSHDPANWAQLPPRDRSEVSLGANEKYLTSYRDLIDRYYQALAEMGRSHGR